jgi:hypothetical protein
MPMMHQCTTIRPSIQQSTRGREAQPPQSLLIQVVNEHKPSIRTIDNDQMHTTSNLVYGSELSRIILCYFARKRTIRLISIDALPRESPRLFVRVSPKPRF